jgi:hypothetical protein
MEKDKEWLEYCKDRNIERFKNEKYFKKLSKKQEKK